MQKKIHLLFFLTLALPLFLSAQDIIDIPPFDDEGISPIAYTIIGDTLANGERANPNRIYRLERGETYILTAEITANYPLSLISGGDESKRPPIVSAGIHEDGQNIRPFFRFTGDGNRHVFKDIMFSGVDLARNYENGTFVKGLVFLADDMSVSFEGCIFNAFTGGATRFEGANASIYFRDCIWRNGVDVLQMFAGQQVTLPALPVDTLIVTNNTYFNNNAFWFFHEDGLVKFALIEHNTIFTSLVDVMRIRFSSNAYIRSNIYYGAIAYGDSDEFQTLGAYEPDGTNASIISLYPVPSAILDEAGIAEIDRLIVLSNNAYFSPQNIKDYWDNHTGISGPEWMNSRTQSMFTSYPSFISHDNIEKDPTFIDTDMDNWVTSKVADFGTTYRATLTPGFPLTGNVGDSRNYDAHSGSTDILTDIQWPLPENLAYSDSDLLVGGHDGLPVGDLNWFPGEKENYEEPTTITTDLRETTASKSDQYNLRQNFPNPFSSKTIITFNVPTKGMTTLKIYDMLGKEIKTLVSEELASGVYEFEFDAGALISGNYFYKLESGNYSGVKKMTILK